MKTSLAIFAATALSFAAFAANTPLLITTLLSDGATNSWTQADLQAALQLTNRKYHRDMQTLNGRRSWHGEAAFAYVTNFVADATDAGVTNVQTALVETFEDGFVYTNKWMRRKAATPTSVAARVASARARRAAALAAQTNGVPAAVAKARQKSAEAVNGASPQMSW